jgi:hypothetical protein
MSLQVSEIAASGGSGIVTVPANNLLYASGSILQVQTASSGPARQTISSTVAVAITGLSVEFTPLFATSRIVVHAQISTSATYVSSFAVFKNAVNTTSTVGFTNSDEANMNFTVYNGADSSEFLYSFPLIWSEIAGSTAVRTYQIYGSSAWAGSTRALHINNRNSNDMASFSHMIVTEVAQ